MEIEQPLVSVIVPNYNHEKYLQQRLESIFNQTYPHFEVILMDDCSTDNSLSILNRYRKHEKVSTCIFNESNTGNTFKQWAKGISLAKGDLIWIAETDDYCETNFLEELVQPFQNDSKVVLAYCQSNRVNEYGEVTGNWITHTNDLDPNLFLNKFTIGGNEFIEKCLINRNVIPNASAVLFRNDAEDVIGHFETVSDFRTCGDWMFYVKLIVNKKVCFNPNSLNNFRYHSNSVIAKTIATENQVSIINIDIEMRKNIIAYLKQKRISNIDKVIQQNIQINRNNIYEKALLYIKSNNKIKGFCLLFTVIDVFYKSYNLRKNLRVKTLNVFKKFFHK